MSCMRQYIQVLVHSDPTDVGLNRHRRGLPDRAGVPDLLVRWIILIGGGGDSRDPTTNE
jgi:hypothetical protein